MSAKPKRVGTPRPKPQTLKASWGRLDGSNPDLVYTWGEGTDSCDARLLHYTFACGRVGPARIDKSFIEELESRGYDVTTFKFSIQKKEGGK